MYSRAERVYPRKGILSRGSDFVEKEYFGPPHSREV